MSRGDSRETTLNFQVNRSSWHCCSSRSRGWYLARERVLRTVFFFFFSLSFLKLLVSTRREGWGIYSRRGVFFTLPATSARIDQLFIGRESGSTSLEEKERASWHEWIKGNSSGNYADFSIFFSPPLDLDCPSTGFVASFFSSLPR